MFRRTDIVPSSSKIQKDKIIYHDPHCDFDTDILTTIADSTPSDFQDFEV